jgi:uncharacterized RDD family membrane protein YckC
MDRWSQHPPYAGFWVRAAARIVDVVLILAVFNLVYLADRLGEGAGLWTESGVGEGVGFSPSDVVRGIFFLAFPIFYYVYLHGNGGQTFGKMALKIKVVNEDGSPLDYSGAFLRWLAYFLCDLTLNIGYVWAAFDARKQGLHDKVCRTVVVRTGVPAPLPTREAPPASEHPASPPLDTPATPPL